MSNSTTLPPPYVEGSYWYYAPNKIAPIVFIVLFASSGLMHLYQCYHFKAWKIAMVLPWAAVLFVAGFIMRDLGAFHYDNLDFMIASNALLVLAPPVYEVANYLLLGRILYYVPYQSPVHPGRFMVMFLAIQGWVEVFNINGAWRAHDTNISYVEQAVGKGLITTALVMQIFSMLVFVSVSARFQYNLQMAGLLSNKMRNILYTLYTSCTLINIRTVYRCVEYWAVISIDVTNYSDYPPVLKHEWFFYVFEASIMIITSFLFNIMFPLKHMPQNPNIFLAMDGVTEVEGPGFRERRVWYVAMIDPCDLYGWATGRSKNDEKFWEVPELQETELTMYKGKNPIEDV